MSERSDRLIELVRERDLDAMLVGDLVNVRYLTGYSGTNGMALAGPRMRTFITDFRYVQQAAEEVDPSFARVQASLDLIEAVPEALGDEPLRLGFEEAHMTVRQHDRLRELLDGRVELVGAGDLVEGMRAVKEPHEVHAIRAAAELADGAFEQLLADGLAGRTEREVAIALELLMRERGAARPSFETIVASGPHGALPHAQPRDQRIEPGQLVVIDWGAELEGYCSDCTRTVGVGEPGAQERELYQLVLDAQLAGLGAVRSGRSGRDVDAVARDVIDAGGHKEHFGHGLGHGVGLEIHEGPRLSQRSEDTLAAGNVVTVEPGVYIPERFGIRIEDLVVVSDSGCEILNSLGKEMIVVG